MSSAGTEPAAHPAGGPGLPADDHVHTEFSWDAANRGSMDASCEQAIELGLPSIAFTEHVDPTPWVVPDHATAMFGDDIAAHIGDDLRLRAPAVDFEGYFASIERCRVRYPSLRIVTGLEIGEPHWHPQTTRALLGSGRFERVLGSLHSLTIGAEPRLIDEWFRTERVSGAEEAAAVRHYLGEAITMIETSDEFEVFAHIDYLVRQIEAAGRAHDPRHFEAEYRETLLALARSDRVLEVNTRIPLDPVVVSWWYDVGGRAVSFGSDAHTPGAVGHGFADAAAVAEAVGFGPAADPRDFWRRGSPVA